jgi:rhamnogalacturonyl hydrolase YesR
MRKSQRESAAGLWPRAVVWAGMALGAVLAQAHARRSGRLPQRLSLRHRLQR